MKKIYKIIILILIISFSLSQVVFAEDSFNNKMNRAIDELSNIFKVDFSDIKNTDWFYNNVKEMIELGIVNGYPDGTFKPNSSLNFEEFIKMVVVSIHNDVDTINSEKWYIPYTDIAIKNNYITENDMKYINTNITRKKMAEILYNVISVTENIQSLTKEEIIYIDNQFSDLTTNDVKTLTIAKIGIINGYLDGTFKPNNSLKRSEATTVILRLINKDTRVPMKIELPKTLADFEAPNFEYLYNLPCHVWNKPYTVSKLNEMCSNNNDTYEIAQVTTDFMNLISNVNYNSINVKELKNSLVYYLHDSVEYKKVKYEYLTDKEVNTDENLFDSFLKKYVKDLKDNNVQIQGEFYTEAGLSIFVHGKIASRGILRFKIESAKDLNLVKEIMFIRDTENENFDNLRDEVEYGGYDNSRYIKNSAINLKLNTWYEIGVDVIMTNVARTGSYVYQKYDTSDYAFVYMCPLYIKELK